MSLAKKTLGTPKLFVITLMIDTSDNEDSVIDLCNYLASQIHANDFSFNIMYADREQLSKNRRANKIA